MSESLAHCLCPVSACVPSGSLCCTEQVEIREAKNDIYAAVVDNKLAIKIGPGAWTPEKAGVDMGQKAWSVAMSGYMFTIWEAEF